METPRDRKLGEKHGSSAYVLKAKVKSQDKKKPVHRILCTGYERVSVKSNNRHLHT
jgi:hypothetical protein